LVLFGARVVLDWPLERPPWLLGPYFISGLGAIPFAFRIGRGRKSRGAFPYVLIAPILALNVLSFGQMVWSACSSRSQDRLVPALVASFLAWLIAVAVLYRAGE
jgi:hypothetical protein